MRLRDLASLRDDMRKAADIEFDTDRFPDSECNEHLNQSIIRLYTMLDQMDNTYYFDTFVFQTSLGQATYPLPANFWSLKGVVITLSGLTTIRARKFMPEEASLLDNAQVWNTNTFPVFYRLRKDDIIFKPAPTGTTTVTLEYTPVPQRLKEDTDTFDGKAGFERWVILDAAIKCKMKDSLDSSMLDKEKAEVEGWITSVGSDRDVGATEFIQDVQSDNVGRYFYDPW